MKKIAIVTDTWSKNLNGVVHSILITKRGLEKMGYKVLIIHPELFPNFPLPYYAEIRMARLPKRRLKKILDEFKPDFIHIATEGTLGLAARNLCLEKKWNFTSSYHTRMPEYVSLRIPPLKKMTYNYLRWFHSKSQKTLVSTDSLRDELEKNNFKKVITLPLGIDLNRFKRNPLAKKPENLKSPIFVFLGRIAPEKNIQSFLECKLPGSKLVIGDGPQRKMLESKFGERVVFVGYKKGKALIDLLSISDVLVFPSRTDTFGLAIIEALACELPVAAYDVQGPKNIITNAVDGYLGEDLALSAKKCLTLNKKACRKTALKYSMNHHVEEFIKNLSPI